MATNSALILRMIADGSALIVDSAWGDNGQKRRPQAAVELQSAREREANFEFLELCQAPNTIPCGRPPVEIWYEFTPKL
jgi:hypothetical protein